MSKLAPVTFTLPQASTSVETSHKVLVSVAVLVVVLIVAVEVAGTGHHAAVIVGLLFVGAFMILGMSHATEFANWSKTLPFIPQTSVKIVQ